MAMAIAMLKCTTCGKPYEFRREKKNRKEADAFVKWAEENMSGECRECWIAGKQAERAQARKAAISAATHLGLPELKGSEKQVSWAFDIRGKAVQVLVDAMDRHKADKAYCTAMQGAIQILGAEASAKYWIDNRDRFDTTSINSLLYEASALNPDAYAALEDQVRQLKVKGA